MTNGDEHVADLRREAGGAPVVTTFSSENGEAALRRHFADVDAARTSRTRAVFPDREHGLGLPATRPARTSTGRRAERRLARASTPATCTVFVATG